MNVIEKERPEGIIVQFGGQTPLKLSTELHKLLTANPIPASSGNGNVKIWGTQPDRCANVKRGPPPGWQQLQEEEAGGPTCMHVWMAVGSWA